MSGDTLVAHATEMLLAAIGETDRPGLADTPRRVSDAWAHWARGYGISIKDLFTTFEDGAESYDQIVLVRDIPVYSHCEHHLAEFFGHAHIGYIPNGRILGLSKFVRLVDAFSARLQVQERLTAQIATAISDHMEPIAVGVVLECRHLCMESRGVCAVGTTTTTSAMHGAFRTDPEARAELMRLIR